MELKMINLEMELQEFFKKYPKKNFNNRQYSEILKPLKYQLWWFWWLKKLKILFCVVIVISAIHNIELLNVNSSAILRIIMIEILPIWNWKYLYNAKCLIKIEPSQTRYNNNESYNSSIPADCSVCESIDRIDYVKAIDYDVLLYKYLLRNAPVVIIDSHQPVWAGNELIKLISNNEKFLSSEPCSMKTNLLHGDHISLYNAFQSATHAAGEMGAPFGWFMYFRNCKNEDIKVMRLLIPQAYFYSSAHFETSSSTWLLMSKNYTTKIDSPQSLDLRRMVIIMQLQGSLEVVLTSKSDCEHVCIDFAAFLHEGESLILTMNMWNFAYYPAAGENHPALTEAVCTYTSLKYYRKKIGAHPLNCGTE